MQAAFRRLATLMLIGGIVSLGSTHLSGQDKEQPDLKKDKKEDKKDEKVAEGDKLKATIVVKVPEASKVEVKVEDFVSKKSGSPRTFVTPPLEAGKTYTYKITLLIEPNNYTKITRVKDVEFKAGDKIEVDMGPKTQLPDDKIVIRWVPTPKDIVEKMGELAKIGKDDIVYDLGCGDAVMLTTALKKYSAKKGVGIELDPKKVEEAIANVASAGLKDKIDIRKGDILELKEKEISDCSVMMLYMGNEMNMLLRPMLWRNLKVGTRVVSHRFEMGDWTPEKTIVVNGEDGEEYTLHVWTVTEKEKEKAKK